MRRGRWAALAVALLLIVAFGAILVLVRDRSPGSFVDSDQTTREDGQALGLEPGHTLGQTFVARHAGINGLEIYLVPSPDAQGRVILHLRDDPLASEDILTSAVNLPPGTQEGFHRFTFPAISSSHSQYYYAFLEHTGTGKVEAAVGTVDSYLDGTLYRDGQPLESQMVFRLAYDPASIVLDLVLMVGNWLAFGLAALALLFFSGYWLIRRWALRAGLDFTASLILSSVAALAAWMVLLVWASLLLRLASWSVWLVVGTSCLAGMVLFVRDREHWQRREYWLGPNPLSTVAFWGVVLLSIALRLFVGRGMIMLPGSDTYHHALIVQLFEEQGGIPSSYEPYSPLISYSYHFGFHSIVALFRWLLATELLVTTKTVAAVLNGAIAAMVGIVAERWAGSRRAGVIAAAAVGLIAVSPFTLLRWGRFTQTTGMLLLAAGLLAVLADRKHVGWVLPSLLIAGLAASHFRVVLLLAIFLAIAFCARLFQRRWKETRDWLILGLLSVLAAAPWLVRSIWVQYDPQDLRPVVPVLAEANKLTYLEEPVLSFVTNGPLLAVLVLSVGTLWLGRRLRKQISLVAIWGLVAMGGTLALSLLGVNAFLDVKTTALSMALPLGILVGASGELLWTAFQSRWRTLARAGIVIILLAGVALGLLYLPGLVQGDALHYLRPADERTMAWIEENLPDDALFLVDSTEIRWSPDWVVGIDAGYWIPLLAHRYTTVPPMIYPLEWGDQDKLQPILETSQAFLAWNRTAAPPLDAVIEEYGFTHVFFSQPPSTPSPSEIGQISGLREIYRLDRTRIFEATP
ncbi:MAG: hypothetical protein GWN58_31735 [Anaerolineae bacterium]|nr:hypothetical protein [Anaerolineae bacterium]